MGDQRGVQGAVPGGAHTPETRVQIPPPQPSSKQSRRMSLVEAITNGVAVALAGFITWLMARPKINAILTQVGIGAKPKYAA